MAYTTINKSSDYFRTKIYTGNGTDDRDITWDESSNMQPDMLWSKGRSVIDNHSIYDIVRGSGLELRTNTTDADLSRTNNIQALQTNGFQVGTDSQVNGNNSTYVSWGWKANGTGSANTDGSISSTVSANTTSGFSIVSYTGTGSNATVGHGLSSTPKMIIVKNRTVSGFSWYTYHTSIGATKNMYLNNTDTPVTASDRWNDTEPTSSVFSVGTNGGTNGSGNNMIAYCFAEKTGYSKIGSYTGNASDDGPFVYTGFKPAFVIIRRTDDPSGRDWFLLDIKRDTKNPVKQNLETNTTDAEVASERCDFLSNGFKLTNGSGGSNASGANHIYMAFAEAPLVGSNNIPCTAR